jgi:hypothetical protein
VSDLKATSDDVRYAYRLLLGREPDSEGFQHYCDRVEREKLDPEAIARCLIGSPEFVTEHGILTKLKLDAGACPPSGVVMLCCRACTQAQLETPAFRYWASQLGEVPGLLHRKLWEWCFITQALYERGMLREGRHGLGFAVGNEPLTGLFAKLGCSIVASDVGVEIARREGWVNSHQHASDPAQLNRRGLCPPDEFAERVRFREVDMRAIPDDLRGFDFLWSSCALEHLGSLDAGADYVIEAMACLREGGVAVHTTELNCDSDVETTEVGGSVIYRRHDLLALAETLQNQGHRVEPLDFDLGTSEADKHVEEPPYQSSPQLKLRLGAHASTSFGLIVQKKS